MKPIDQDQDEDARDRFARLVAAEARGEPVAAADADFRRRHEATHPDAAADADLFGAIGGLGATSGAKELSDAALLARVMERARQVAGTSGASVRLVAPAASQRAPARSPARRRGIAAAVAAGALAATLVVAFAGELRARLFAPVTAGDPSPAPIVAPTEASRELGGAPIRAAEGPAIAPDRPPSVDAPPVSTLPTDPSAEAPGKPVSLGETPRPSAQSGPPSPSPAVRAATPPPVTDRTTADELLRRAQAHLAAGRATEAIEAYRDLCARYPASAEGRAALVSLGRIALDQGRAEEALGQLDRYLTTSGPLDEEARYWRIEALSRLHRAADEATAIDEFLRRHPDSVHAQRLRARATGLGGD